MKDSRIRPARRRGCILGLPLVLFALGLGNHHLYGDTYGYEFRPGPHVPAGFSPGPGVDASGMDLSGSAFVGMNLGGSNFERCNLQRAVFAQVRFPGSVSFKGADLRNAIFTETPDGPPEGWAGEHAFMDALINGMQLGGLNISTQYAHLSLEQLCSTKSFKLKDLSGCQIVGGVSKRQSYNYFELEPRPVAIDFHQFNLRDAVFVAGDITESDFTDAIITGATFFKSKITPAQIASTSRFVSNQHGNDATGLTYMKPFRALVSRPASRGIIRVPHSDLTNLFDGVMLSRRSGYADLGFSYMDLSTWDFASEDLRGARFCEVNLTGVDFTGADISEAHFWKSISREQLLATRSYQTRDLLGVVFARLDLSAVDFSRQNLTRAHFVRCNLAGADFTDAVITDADFSACGKNPPTPEQIKSTWNYKHGRMDGVRLPDDLAKALREK